MVKLKERWDHLNLQYLISTKVLYFTLNLEMYAFYLYRAIFIKQFLGVSTENYGIIASVMACVSFPSMTIWGTLADALGRPKLLLTILALCTAATFDLLYFRFEAGTFKQFAYVLGVLIVYSIFCAGLQPLLDTIALKILTANPAFSKELYGRQRLWGTLAYAIVNLTSAFLMDAIGMEVLFLIVPATALIFAITLLFSAPKDTPRSVRAMLRERASKKKEATEARVVSTTESLLEGGSGRQRHPVLVLITNPSYLFFLLAVFMTGLARTTMTNFLALYLDQGMKLNKKKIAVAATFGIFLEVIIFFFGIDVSAWLGNYWMLVLAQAATALRSWLYFLMPDDKKWYPAVLAVELLKGVAIGFTHLAGVKTAAAAAPPQLQATSQSIYSSIYAQLPAVIAAFVGALLYKRMGPHALFLIVAIISTVSMAAFLAKYVFDGSIKLTPFGKRQRKTAANDSEHLSGVDVHLGAVRADQVILSPKN